MQTAILVQQELFLKNEIKKTKEDEILEKIGREVEEIVCFGSNNRPGPKKVEKFFKSLITPLKKLFFVSTETERLKSLETQQTVVDAGYDSICGLALEQGNMDKYFVQGEFNGKRETLFNPAVLPIILESLIEKQRDGLDPVAASIRKKISIPKNACVREDILAILGSSLFHWVTKNLAHEKLLKGKEAIVQAGLKYLNLDKQEPLTLEDRQLVMQSLVHDVKYAAFYFGIGNCQIMAECAFLLALQKVENTQIRYIRFTDSKEETEELNLIALGAWPKAGSLLLAPWLSERPYHWQGSFDKTEAFKKYDVCHVLFTVKDDEERKFWRAMLERKGFDGVKLLKHKNRAYYTEFTINVCDKILGLLNSLQEELDVKLKLSAKA